jgi:hypothetical protein
MSQRGRRRRGIPSHPPKPKPFLPGIWTHTPIDPKLREKKPPKKTKGKGGKKKKKLSKWNKLVSKVCKKYPNKSFQQCVKIAKKLY